MLQSKFFDRKWIFQLALCTLFLVVSLSEAKAEKTHFLVAGVGLAGVLDKDHEIVFGVLEFRPAWFYKSLQPWFSIMSSDQEFFVGGGLMLDYEFVSDWYVTPGFGLGCYLEDNGLKLGSHLEFKSFLELSYVLPNDSRIGLRLSHLSNAGLGDRNPGAESFSVLYSHPF